jgi:uncharacterized protein YgiM (DUF1202 family)
LRKNDQVRVLSATGGGDLLWYAVQYQGQRGWMLGKDLTLLGEPTQIAMALFPTPTPTITPTPFAATVTVKETFGVALRSGPGASYPVVKGAKKGDQFAVLAQYGAAPNVWYMVVLPDGSRAWIWSSNVDLNPKDAQIQVAASIPTPPPAATRTPVTQVNAPASKVNVTNLTCLWFAAEGTVNNQPICVLQADVLPRRQPQHFLPAHFAARLRRQRRCNIIRDRRTSSCLLVAALTARRDYPCGAASHLCSRRLPFGHHHLQGSSMGQFVGRKARCRL